MVPFEEQNVDAYRLLLRIEVAVREVLRFALQADHGDRWQRQLLQTMKELIREAQADESKRRQFDFVKLGPLYYLTLGDLLPLLKQNKPAVVKAVAQLGGSQFINQLENILPVRNAVAHNRSVSPAGLAAIRALYHQIEASLTPETLAEVTANPDIGIRPEESAPSLRNWLTHALESVQRLDPTILMDPTYEKSTAQYWWDMSDACPFGCSLVDAAARLVANYNQLPGGVGSASHKQAFVMDNHVADSLRAAIDSFQGLT